MELILPWTLAYILDQVIPQKDPKKILLWSGVILRLLPLLCGQILSPIGWSHGSQKIRRNIFVETCSTRLLI